jgi:hypothetical protein
MDLARIEFQQLRIKHIFFKSKVRSILFGANYDNSFFENENPVDIWFNTIGKVNYVYDPIMQELIREHKYFKNMALQLTHLYKSGKIEQAHAGLSEINSISEKFLSLLDDLESRISGNNIAAHKQNPFL